MRGGITTYLAVMLLTSLQASADHSPQIHTVSYKESGKEFQHFQFRFTQENLKLPHDIPGRIRLDDHAINFEYGQFEVFVHSSQLKLPQNCERNYIIRMLQTLNKNPEQVATKQRLYHNLKSVYYGEKASFDAVVEITDRTGCNLYFRSFDGGYISYTGPLK
jgi:hypothetical protein